MADKEPPPTPKSRLETLSREDLIRFAKKQAISCKQFREKNEELEAKLKNVTAVSAATSSPSSSPSCHVGVQTAVAEVEQEESQWLRHALSSSKADDRREPPAESDEQNPPVILVEVSCQTSSNCDSATVECQTEPPPPSVPRPEVDPDALKEAKTQMALLAKELDEARRELASQSLWKLEMEDTERSFAKLQSELRQSASQLEAARAENALLGQDLRGYKERLSNADLEREELKRKLADANGKADALSEENGADKLELHAMRSKLETLESELDRMKLDVASDASSTEKKLVKIQTTLDETKTRLEKSENARTVAEKQLEELNSEYRAYRTRVHSVLKQQERKTAISGSITTKNRDDDDESANLLENRKLDQQLIASLREQLEKSKQLYESCRCDLERVREQHDQLYERHRMLRVHADEVEAQWKCELESMRSDAARVARLHAEQIRTLTADKRDLQRDFERRIEELLAERRERVGMLEQRIAALDDELAWATKKNATTTTQLSSDNIAAAAIGSHRNRNWSSKNKETEPAMDAAKDERRRGTGADLVTSDYSNLSSRPLMERKPAEGAENADPAKKSSSVSFYGHDDAIVENQRSLEDLLGDQQSVHSYEASIMGRASRDEDNTNNSSSSAAVVAKLHHVTELLSESEANNSRLSEQIKILKDEIRRLERNTERSEHVANAEYLKNVIMQFLNPAMRDRRQRLLPVLTTLLRLSPDEVGILAKEATTADAASASSSGTTSSSGWGGYMHRWSGLN